MCVVFDADVVTDEDVVSDGDVSDAYVFSDEVVSDEDAVLKETVVLWQTRCNDLCVTDALILVVFSLLRNTRTIPFGFSDSATSTSHSHGKPLCIHLSVYTERCSQSFLVLTIIDTELV